MQADGLADSELRRVVHCKDDAFNQEYYSIDTGENG